MFENFPLFPDQASTVAKEVDMFYYYLVSISVFFSLLIAGLIVFFAIKYRRRSDDEMPKPIVGSLHLELIWTVIPLLIALSMFAWGAKLYYTMQRVPKGALDVYVVGKQWMWKFQHVTGQREINELHIPVGRAIKLTMSSEDVIHSLFVPDFRVKADVIPGRYRVMWFEATKPGKYRLFCTEYCGTKHAGMIGNVIVMEPAAFEEWLSGGPAAGSMVQAGEKLFSDFACNTCHMQTDQGRGPALTDLFGQEVNLADGTKVKADEVYIRESIVHPQAKIVSGFQPIMPTFEGQISEDGLLQLIAYIKSMQSRSGTESRATGVTQTQQNPTQTQVTTNGTK